MCNDNHNSNFSNTKFTIYSLAAADTFSLSHNFVHIFSFIQFSKIKMEMTAHTIISDFQKLAASLFFI